MLASSSPARTVIDPTIFPDGRIVNEDPSARDFGPYSHFRESGRVRESQYHKQAQDHPLEESMSKLPAPRQSRSLLPDLSELFAGFPPFAGLRPIFDSHLMRLEEDMKDGRYEVRAELPGIDPAKDVEITVRDGQLRIKGERAKKNESNGRSEFTYGSFARSISLPVGADEDDITATYDQGILTVSVPIADIEQTEKHVEVQSAEPDVEGESAEQLDIEVESTEQPDGEVRSTD